MIHVKLLNASKACVKSLASFYNLYGSLSYIIFNYPSYNYLAFCYQYSFSINNQVVGAFGLTIVSSFIYNLR